jgi:hypothetical protein
MSSVIKILLILALLQVLACKNETGVVNKKDIIPRNENVCNDEKLEDYKSLSIIELDEQKMKILKSNTRLPEIRIFTIGTGRLGLLEDYLNSDFTIINLWSSSCQTSTKNISSLKELWEKYNSDGLNIVTLSIDQGENSFSELENLRSDNEVKWPTMLLDDGIQSSLCEQLNIKNIPQIIILNKEYKATKTDYPYTLNDNLDKLISSLISDNKKK